jgi:hypothetical protein
MCVAQAYACHKQPRSVVFASFQCPVSKNKDFLKYSGPVGQKVGNSEKSRQEAKKQKNFNCSKCPH